MSRKKVSEVKVGDRVRIPSVDIKGVVTYIDYPTIYQHHMYPIQVLLDKPHDPVSSKQRVLRTNYLDIRKLKKGRRRRKRK